MKTFWIIYWIFVVVYTLAMIGMYLVKDYRKGIIYKGLTGYIQNLIKH